MSTEDIYVAACTRAFPNTAAGVDHERDCEDCRQAKAGEPNLRKQVDELLTDIIAECRAAGWPKDSVVDRRVASIRESAVTIRHLLRGEG